MPSKHRTKYGMRWRARILDHGRPVELGLYDTWEEADATERAARDLRDENPQTVGEWVQCFADLREQEGLHRGASRYQVLVGRILRDDIARRPLRSLTEPDVRAFVRRLVRTPAMQGTGRRGEGSTPTSRTLSRSAVSQTLVFLRQALERGVEDGAVRTNAARNVRVPKMARTTEGWDWLRANEVEALLGLELSTERRAIYTTAIFTGLRSGELWGLRWEDVHLRGHRLELVVRFSYRNPTKSGQVRRVPLLPRAVDALRAWARERPGVGHALVFPADVRNRKQVGTGGCHASGYDAGLHTYLRRAGLRRVRFHDLRHTCASHLVQGTWTARPLRLEEVRMWLGHSTIAMSERYAHLSPGGLHDVARAIDFGVQEEARALSSREEDP